MKRVIISVFTVCVFLVSCDGKETVINHYYKSFFLAENSFQMEGEVFDINLMKPISFDSLIVRISKIDETSDLNGEWEVSAKKTSENRFQLLIDKTVNEITLEKGTITDNMSRLIGLGFPPDYPMCVLSFHIDENEMYTGFPFNMDIEASNVLFFNHYYVYIAEPININHTNTYNDYFVFDRITVLEHYDLNFPKSGWYKIVSSEDKKIENAPIFSSGENTYIKLLRTK